MSPVGTKIPPEEWARIQKLLAKHRKREDEDRPPGIYGYRRCSHTDSAFSQYGLDDQQDDLERFVERLLTEEEFKGYTNGGVYTDEVVSGAKIAFCSRRQGQLLNAKLRPGDVVVFPRVDRASRNVADFAHTLKVWWDRGITAMFAQEGLSYGRPRDRTTIYIHAVIAEDLATSASESAKRTAARQIAQHGQSGGKARYGYQWTGPRGKRRLIPDRQQRQIGQLVVRIVDKHPDWSWQEVSDEVHRRIAAAKGESLPPLAQRKGWCRSVCKAADREERKLQVLEREQREKKQPAN